ncbi:MAG: hypothetical protein KatS3mg077_0688 [Candidatus Binatia bacterium]|nr:MAG: hypothetical protein KatS3mg077_0688 [Candidatus Binatia bacterium]
MPVILDAVHGMAAARRLEVVLWNIDTDTERAKAFLQQHLARYPNVVLRFDPGGQQFHGLGAPGMPATFIVQAGITRAVFGGYKPGVERDILSALQQVLATQGPPAED